MRDLSTLVQNVQGQVVRKMDSAINRIVIFQLPQKRIKSNAILSSKEIKSDFNSKMLIFNIGFTI